jgi:hypothetical protein
MRAINLLLAFALLSCVIAQEISAPIPSGGLIPELFLLVSKWLLEFISSFVVVFGG